MLALTDVTVVGDRYLLASAPPKHAVEINQPALLGGRGSHHRHDGARGSNSPKLRGEAQDHHLR
jgi:hypothetical protein